MIINVNFIKYENIFKILFHIVVLCQGNVRKKIKY